MKKQTEIEKWIEEAAKQHTKDIGYQSTFICGCNQTLNYLGILEIENPKEYLAKAMQKKELFEFFQAGQNSMEEGGKGFEQYYNETYKGGNK